MSDRNVTPNTATSSGDRLTFVERFFYAVGAIVVGATLGYLLTVGVLVTFTEWCP